MVRLNFFLWPHLKESSACNRARKERERAKIASVRLKRENEKCQVAKKDSGFYPHRNWPLMRTIRVHVLLDENFVIVPWTTSTNFKKTKKTLLRFTISLSPNNLKNLHNSNIAQNSRDHEILHRFEHPLHVISISRTITKEKMPSTKNENRKKTRVKFKIPSNVGVNLPFLLQFHPDKLISNVLRSWLVVVRSFIIRKANGQRGTLDFLGKDIALVQK